MSQAAEPASPPAGAERTIREAYGFAEVVVGEPLRGGYANDLFRVVADGRNFVLRLEHPPVLEDDLAWEHRLARSLARRLPEVPAPVPARDGATLVRVGWRAGCLLPFVQGAPADPAREEDRLAAAHALGRLHRVGSDVRLPRRPRLRPLAELEWPPAVVAPEVEAWRETILRARAWAMRFVAGLASGRDLLASLIHGDFFPGNVLVADGHAVGVVDWEEAQVDWLVWDLANGVGTFCSFGDDLSVDREAARRFVAAYREAGGTAPRDDDELVLPLIRVKRVLEVLRAPTDRDPRWEHQQANLRSLDRLPDAPG